MNKPFLYLLLLVFQVIFSANIRAQNSPDSTLSEASLDQCIDYALKHQPQIKQSYLDQEIAEKTIAVNLASWLPQVDVNYSLQHYLELPTSLFPDFNNPSSGERTPVQIGVSNTSNILLEANQVLYSNDVMFASSTAKYYRLQASQNTINTKIDLTVSVSKAYYDVLTSIQQLDAIDEDIIRQRKNVQDTKNLFETGIVDETDYQRAVISLNNVLVEKKSAEEAILYKKAFLKQLMGYPSRSELQLSYDTTRMMSEVPFDTTQRIDYEHRIEYQQLQTQKELNIQNVSYYRWGFLPTISAFYNYNLNYQNNAFSDLYNRNFPNSLLGLKVSVPIFQGMRRTKNFQKARLMEQRLDLGIENLQHSINTEYQLALGNYKSSLKSYETIGENLDMARNVYRVINLQYQKGIRNYLDLISAETDLRTAELNYYSALYKVLAAKMDLKKALGEINIVH